jgi:Ni,Fe-hydrogenase I cytochrome b subunit
MGSAPDTDVDRTSPANTPRWVKVFGVVVFALFLVFVVLHLTGIALGGHQSHRGHVAPPSGP